MLATESRHLTHPIPGEAITPTRRKREPSISDTTVTTRDDSKKLKTEQDTRLSPSSGNIKCCVKEENLTTRRR